jgi:hypothetical protein
MLFLILFLFVLFAFFVFNYYFNFIKFSNINFRLSVLPIKLKDLIFLLIFIYFILIFDYNTELKFFIVASFVKFNENSNLPINSSNFDNNNNQMNPYYITGFADGESTFVFSIVRSKASITGWTVTLEFKLIASLNPANELQFNLIKDFFKVGSVKIISGTDKSSPYIIYTTRSLQDCIVIRNHFLKYPLFTYKLVHFNLWCKVIDLIINKEHLTEEGLNKIVALKAYSPKGVSDSLQAAFPLWEEYQNFLLQYNPELSNMNWNWLSGFIQADGHFGCSIRTNYDTKLGKQALAFIEIVQHTNSLIVLEQIKTFLGTGTIYIKNNISVGHLKIQGLKNANLFINNFNNNTKLYGSKELDYMAFCKIVSLMNEGKHLTEEGFTEILNIVNSMNAKRTNYNKD